MTLTTKPKNYPKIAQKRMWSQLLKTNYSCAPTRSNKTEKHKSFVHTAASLFAYARTCNTLHFTAAFLQQKFQDCENKLQVCKESKSSFPVTIPYRISLKRSNARAKTFDLSAWMNKVPNKSLTKYLYWRKNMKGDYLQRLRLNG